MKSSKTLDPFDLAILRILQKDNTVPQRVIGERVNLSAPSVQRRIKRLEASGIIAAQTATVDPAGFGPALTIVVQVELNVETGGAIDVVKQSFIDAPEIQQCYYVTGEADFVLIILVQDMSEYEALTQRLFFSNETIKKFKTFVTMDRTKVSLEIDI
ncbi:transcriptional regulator, AsnC family [Octadecabacter temperatus]|uniref:Leucine-responsive regulatory protein n=1 Tax=Octadecabacter temperatus TaxID=1458307 RepID=A0A0K0Y6E5_9RHOB|nr:Lrp/AsnC family transcriptional regulator [Octadecabacter temperatus]AKS46417.1 Leucine-responsive regulatory protein [Octadecabacter temperatus]SIO13613.1 transcriptional regulator, AsnC family [Octadecabacter temperatus]